MGARRTCPSVKVRALSEVTLALGADILIPLLFAVILITIALAILAYRRWRGTVSGRRGRPKAPSLEPGFVYALPDAQAERAFRVFGVEVARGAKGLVLSRLRPEDLRERYRIGLGVQTQWLSRAYGKEAANPTNLGALAHDIERFVSGKENSIVLVDGLEYLLVQADSDEVVKFVRKLGEIASNHRSKVLLPINPKALQEAHRAPILRDVRAI